MTPTRLQWASKQNAIDASIEMSNHLKMTIYVKAQTYGFHPYEGTQYVLKTSDQIMDFDSTDIIHVQQYQPGEKTINEVLEQNDERVKI